MKHLGTIELETDRLLLRRLTMDDAFDMYHNWASDKKVTEYLTWPAHDSVQTTKALLDIWTGHYIDDDFYQWGIIQKDINKVIGTISVVEQNPSIRMVHVGYSIGQNWWGQGYMTEAFKRVIRFFFEDVQMNRIESEFDPRNVGSGIVMQKCGLIYEGTARQASRNNQGICDAARYAILAEDYFETQETN